MPIMVSDKAAGQLANILGEQGKPDALLRVWVAGLGCSGFRYGMGIEDRAPEQDDAIFDANGIRVVIDPQSLSYMDGSTVDWIEDPVNGGFSIANPNPAPETECGCGGACSTGKGARSHADPASAATSAEGSTCGCGGSCDCQKGSGAAERA
jgi:iron-sulfur cluster assembly accessory protein